MSLKGKRLLGELKSQVQTGMQKSTTLMTMMWCWETFLLLALYVESRTKTLL